MGYNSLKYFQLGAIYTDGMIFQRERPIYIEGESFFEGEITASIGTDTITRAVKHGAFSLKLPPRPAGQGLTLTITAKNLTETYKDIYIGEVWVAGGQSNMSWPLADTGEYRHGAIKTNDCLRFYTVGRNTFASPKAYADGYQWAHSADYGWVGCGTESAPYFSAVGYHFAHTLYEMLQVPIGIINCNAGGSSIYSWMPEEALRQNPSSQPIWEAHDKLMKGIDHRQASDAFYKYLDDYKSHSNTDVNVSGTQYELPTVYYNVPGPYNFQRPAGLYQPMLDKIARFPVRGMLWYQGEHEGISERGHIYASAMESLVNNLIKQQQVSGPYEGYCFNYVQIAPWDDPSAICWADVCEQQRLFFVNNPSYGMVTISDTVSSGTNIHPIRKKKVGERLAYAAMALNYDIPREFTGPIAVKAHMLVDSVCITFTHNERLHQVGELGRFELILDDGSIQEAAAEIRDNAVYLPCKNLSSKPVSVQYEYRSNAVVGLFNRAKIPASLFKIPIER